MSGPTVSRALRSRFERIRQAELERLGKKLRGLSPEDRASVEAITTAIIQAITRVPERALSDDAPQPALDAVVQLFELEGV